MNAIDNLFPLLEPFSREGTIAIAVSGGSDSLALLVLLHEWQKRISRAPQLIALTVDHGLRDAAKNETAYVSTLCADLNIPHHILHWHHENNTKPISAVAEKAREARYTLLAKQAKQEGASYVFLAHTQNDQAETVLMRALHRSQTTDAGSKYSKMGSGFRGLAAMASSVEHQSGIKFARPLLSQDREQLRNILRTKSIKWIDDPTNKNLTLERPRIRAYLEDPMTPFSISILSKFAENMAKWREDAAKRSASHILQWVKPAIHNNTIKKGVLNMGHDFFNHAPLSIQLLSLRALISTIGGTPYLPPVESSQRLLFDLTNDNFTGASLGGAILKPRDGNKHIELWREHRNIEAQTLPLKIKECIWDGRFICKITPPATQIFPTDEIEIRALGHEGIEHIKEHNANFLLDQKQHQILGHPAIWHKNKLIHLPMTTTNFIQNSHSEELSQKLYFEPYIPAFERFKNPLDAPLRKALKSLVLKLYK
jgi:tRNA(Ile)-lysidine synthase